MRRYIVSRLLLIIPSLVISTLIAFLLMHAAPGDPVVIILGANPSSPAEYDRLYKLLGLDQPLYIQYLSYLLRLVSGNWGYSFRGLTPVLPIVLRRAEATFELAFSSLIFGSAVGLALGVLSAMKRGTIIDKACFLISTISSSTPAMISGVILLLIFSVYLGWLPSYGRGGIENLILPTIVLGGWFSGIISRVARVSMLEVINEEFVTTARAKGLSRTTVFRRHILRNASIPIVTVMGLNFGTMFGSAVVTEAVFNYPGLGTLIVERLLTHDYAVVQGSMIFVAAVFILINLSVDILYARLDPRILKAIRGPTK